MGKSGSGKTSMRSIIFADYLARDTTRLSPTIDVEYSSVQFLGNLHLHLWDCGGQDDFYKNYLDNMRDHIFRSVELLVYVFDVESDQLDVDLKQFEAVVEALDQHSPGALVFVLVHKMDLVAAENRDALFNDRRKLIMKCSENLAGVTVECSPSSIWDETLYRAWSQIVYSLVPNTKLLEQHLDNFCRICGADETVLFESTTFLVIAHCEDKAAHGDVHRFEKISNIIKQFKLSCRKAQALFDGMVVQNSRFTAFFNQFTTNTCVMVIVSDPSVHAATIQLNIDAAKPHFERLIPQTAM